MKKILEYFGIAIFFVLSFFYTNKIINIYRSNDPIMESIVSSKIDYETNFVNAKIEGETIIPGASGCTIDVLESYEKMKRINEYTDKLLKYVDLIPEITINDIYNKYIISGNNRKREVAIVINIKDDTSSLLNIEDKINIFVSGDVLNKITKKDNMHIYNGGDNNNYDNITIEWMNDVIEDNFNSSNYCINKNRNDDNLLVCARNKMHTISPSIIVTSNNIFDIKQEISSGSIIYFDENNIKSITNIINYVKSKGYNIVYLDELLNERVCNK